MNELTRKQFVEEVWPSVEHLAVPGREKECFEALVSKVPALQRLFNDSALQAVDVTQINAHFLPMMVMIWVKIGGDAELAVLLKEMFLRGLIKPKHVSFDMGTDNPRGDIDNQFAPGITDKKLHFCGAALQVVVEKA